MRTIIIGKWECKSDTLWTYRIARTTQLYGYVVQYKDAGRAEADWDATVMATRSDDDTTVAEHVSFNEARAALEQYARQHADHVKRAR